MNLDLYILQNHMDIFVESRLASARYHHFGNQSWVVTAIGGMAARLERLSARIERWAHPVEESPVDALKIVNGVR